MCKFWHVKFMNSVMQFSNVTISTHFSISGIMFVYYRHVLYVYVRAGYDAATFNRNWRNNEKSRYRNTVRHHASSPSHMPMTCFIVLSKSGCSTLGSSTCGVRTAGCDPTDICQCVNNPDYNFAWPVRIVNFHVLNVQENWFSFYTRLIYQFSQFCTEFTVFTFGPCIPNVEQQKRLFCWLKGQSLSAWSATPPGSGKQPGNWPSYSTEQFTDSVSWETASRRSSQPHSITEGSSGSSGVV